MTFVVLLISVSYTKITIYSIASQLYKGNIQHILVTGTHQGKSAKPFGSGAKCRKNRVDARKHTQNTAVNVCAGWKWIRLNPLADFTASMYICSWLTGHSCLLRYRALSKKAEPQECR